MQKLIRVGVFYDGGYFIHVDKYYHKRKSRINFRGLHEFILGKVSEMTGGNKEMCKIIDACFFRGRFSLQEMKKKYPNDADLLYKLRGERIFEEVLLGNDIRPYYLPIKDSHGQKREKGIDSLLALETYELCTMKHYDMVVIIAGDGDHVTLVNKLHAIGCKTMLLGWDFEYKNGLTGNMQATGTSFELYQAVMFPLKMSTVIDELLETDEMVKGIFKDETKDETRVVQVNMSDYADADEDE